jgi:hypothetical protein
MKNKQLLTPQEFNTIMTLCDEFGFIMVIDPNGSNPYWLAKLIQPKSICCDRDVYYVTSINNILYLNTQNNKRIKINDMLSIVNVATRNGLDYNNDISITKFTKNMLDSCSDECVEEPESIEDDYVNDEMLIKNIY